jgi:hypothetical protein
VLRARSGGNRQTDRQTDGLDSADPRDFIPDRRRKEMAEICPSERKPSPALSCGVNADSGDRTVAATISENIPPAGPEASSAPVLPDQRSNVALPLELQTTKVSHKSQTPLAFAGGGQGTDILIQSYITNRMRFFGPRGRGTVMIRS